MWLLICIAVLIVNIYLIVGLISLILGAVYQPWRWAPMWRPQGFGGLILAAIISILFYGHCGFLKLPI